MHNLFAGWSLDKMYVDPVTKQRWDLSDPKVQERVLAKIRKDKPLVIGMSPPCTLFSLLQHLRRTPISEEEWRKAVSMVNFCVRVAELQEAAGRFYYFEHPLGASSWGLTDLRRLREKATTYSVAVHMCQFDLRTRNGGLAKKPTRILTNLVTIAEKVNRQCQGGHAHGHLMSGRAGPAAFYTDQFVDAILEGIALYKAWKKKGV